MAYTVFALKWRPNNFDEIVGQKNVVTTLKSALQKNRLAHAYLFAGPRGIGKTSTARILAKALNCKNGSTLEPCGKCSSCIDISQSRSLDVIEIDGASNTGVEDVRSLRENVKFSPTSGKYKIYIIDEVHMLSTAAFNALLKTLEEPPDFVKFIFATTHPDKIPSTVLSRCQRLDFRRISVIEMMAQLENIVKSEKIGVDKEVLFAISRASDGSLRDAESILDQLVSFSGGKVSLKDVNSVLGLVEQDALFEITDKIIEKDPRAVLGLFNSLAEEGKDIGVFLNNLVEHFRNLMIAKVTKGDAKLIDLPQDICDRLLKQSQSLSLDEIFNAFNILANTLEMARRLDSLRITLEVNLIRLANKKLPLNASINHHSKETPLKEKPAAIVKDTKKEEPKNEEAKNEPMEEPISINLDNIKSVWQNVIDALSRIKMSVSTYLSAGVPSHLKGNQLTISFPKSHSLHKESLEKRENREIVENSFFEALNTHLRVSFILSAESKPKDTQEGGHFVQSILDTFNGRLIKES
jgi:DNA polymerase-3 subunit gamma/tau